MIQDEVHKKMMMEKFDFFYSERVPVHINKLDGEWLNGDLINKKSDNVFVLEERLKGEVIVFVSEVKDIDKMRDME